MSIFRKEYNKCLLFNYHIYRLVLSDAWAIYIKML